jgi:predicted acylesterase/phospholipase RssA
VDPSEIVEEEKNDRLRVSASLILRLVTAAVAALMAGGCSLQPRTPYSQSAALKAELVGYQNIRAWLDADAAQAKDFAPTVNTGNVTYLALSGGGGDGAYGAGVLNGWTQSGKRPTFTIVSGVSTGALIAPFAFLGPAYDETLRKVYTDGDAGSLVQFPDFIQAAFGNSLFGSGRILGLVSRYLDASMVEAIAIEHRAGRRLFVVTTNVDSKRGVVWNVGAIAASGRPDSLDLIRKVLAASASVPIAFSPILIDVEADGRTFQEMHADGNATTAVFTVPLQFLAARKRTVLTGGAIYILMNTSIQPKFSVVDNSTLKIAEASIDTLTTQKTNSNLVATFLYARANHIDFNVTSIDPAVDGDGANNFDTTYMRKLYAIGYDTASQGGFWLKSPSAIGIDRFVSDAPVRDTPHSQRSAVHLAPGIN